MSAVQSSLDSNEWHYTDKTDADIGPVTIADMRAAWNDGTLTDQAFIWHPVGVPDWTLLLDIPELKLALAPPPPPPKPKLPPAPKPGGAAATPAVGARPAIAARPGATEVKDGGNKAAQSAIQAAAAASAKRRSSENIPAAVEGESKPAIAPRPAIVLPGTKPSEMKSEGKPVIAGRPAVNAATKPQINTATKPQVNYSVKPQVNSATKPVIAARPGATADIAPKPAAERPSIAPKPAVAAPSAGPSRPVAAKPAISGAHQKLNNAVGKVKKIGKLGGVTVGDWTEMHTADRVPYYHNTATGELTWDKPEVMKDQGEKLSETGHWVWVPDSREGFAVAQVKQKRPDGRYEVIIESTGEAYTTKKGDPVYDLTKSSLRRTEHDLVLLDSLDEGLILYNLRERFLKQRQIYTNIGTILVSINPYETYSIYTTEMIHKYRTRGNQVLDPHVYVVADDALAPILERGMGVGDNHSILISGESGAGKTWNTKQALSYLTEVTAKNSTNANSKGADYSISGRILAANPILEGFGNAKTIRNDNSSRFGRFTEVHFDKSSRIVGARIENFLLEKSRVVHQSKDERSYHVFYQLTKTKSYGAKLGCNSPQDFSYLSKTGVYDVSEVDDEEDFQKMIQAMQEMGLTQEEMDWVFELVAGVLHIGNVTFVSDGGEGSSLTKQGQTAMSSVAKCLKVDQKEVEFGFTHRSIEVNNQVTNIPLKPHDAESSRDALAKSIYGQLFDWLVSRVNVALNGASTPWAFIGLLDIFGFEIFDKNSFEQLCINFTNEKLQQLFNRDTFQKEQAMYRKEGVQFDEIKFIDNQPILDMIEKKQGGLLTMLDDLNRMPKTTDEQFVGKADDANATSPFFVTSALTKKGKTWFTIRHYAGDVIYDATGFLVKNKDLLFADLYDVMSRSKATRTASMFPQMDNNQRSKYSLGAQFRQQLDKLMNQLNTTQTHYIRCIKPNGQKAACQMDSMLTLEQLRYSGVFDAVRIRKQGFPFRYTFERFIQRYKCLMLRDATWVPLKAKIPKDQVKEILAFTGQDFSEIRIGQTMALYRSEQYRLLELLRALALEKVCAMIQAIARGMIGRVYVRRFRATLPKLENALQARDPDVIDKALADYSRVVGSFGSMVPAEPGIVRKVKRIRYALREWERLAVEADELCRQEITNEEDPSFEQLKDVVWTMEKLLDEPGSEWHMQMYDYAKYQFEEERARRMNPLLAEAMDLLERDKLSDVYAECKRLKFEDPRLAEIEKFMGLGEEELLKFQYRNAKKLGMKERAREKETRIRERFLDTHEDMFVFEKFPLFRDPEEFANATLQFWKREELAASMLCWTKGTIKTSLTQLEHPLPKAAIQIHRSILGWCGDKSNPSPNSLAQEVVAHGINTPMLRDEIYALLMKQLNKNESPQSIAQAWKLMALCLQFFPPKNDFSNYLLVFFRKHAPKNLRDRFRDKLYDIEYAGAATVPPIIDTIPSLVAGW